MSNQNHTPGGPRPNVTMQEEAFPTFLCTVLPFGHLFFSCLPCRNIFYILLQSNTSSMNQQLNEGERYCRGCHCAAPLSSFGVFRQCHSCRMRNLNKKRDMTRVECPCGKAFLTSSRAAHLRTLFHEKHMLPSDKKTAEGEHNVAAAVPAGPPAVKAPLRFRKMSSNQNPVAKPSVIYP
jgi:hypothetical protein